MNVHDPKVATQHSVHWTGGYAPRFQALSLAQASSVKMALACPSRQPVTQTVSLQMLFLNVGPLAKYWGLKNKVDLSCQPFRLLILFFLAVEFDYRVMAAHQFWCSVESRFFIYLVLLVCKFIVEQFTLCCYKMVIASCPRACHNIGECFWNIILPALFRAACSSFF